LYPLNPAKTDNSVNRVDRIHSPFARRATGTGWCALWNQVGGHPITSPPSCTLYSLSWLHEDAYILEAAGGAHVCLVLEGEMVDGAAVGAVFVPPDAGGEDGADHDLLGDAGGEPDFAELVVALQPGTFLDAGTDASSGWIQRRGSRPRKRSRCEKEELRNE